MMLVRRIFKLNSPGRPDKMMRVGANMTDGEKKKREIEVELKLDVCILEEDGNWESDCSTSS